MYRDKIADAPPTMLADSRGKPSRAALANRFGRTVGAGNKDLIMVSKFHPHEVGVKITIDPEVATLAAALDATEAEEGSVSSAEHSQKNSPSASSSPVHL